MWFELYRDSQSGVSGRQAGEWRWRLRLGQTNVLAVCCEGYKNEQDCIGAIASVIMANVATPIINNYVGRTEEKPDWYYQQHG